MKKSTIYFFKDAFYVHTNCKTLVGAWILYPPIYKIEENNEESLGKMVLESLRDSKTNVLHPTDFKALISPLLVSAQVKSWNAFAKTALCLSAEETDGLITIVPYQKANQTRGYEPLLEKSRTLKEFTPLQLGEAILLSIGDCK